MTFDKISLFHSTNKLFYSLPETDFSKLIKEGCKLANTSEQLLEMIDRDLDNMALKKKQERLDDEAWINNHTASLFDDKVLSSEEKLLQLSVGRPRMPALVVLTFLLIRGYLGGIKNKKNIMLILESQTLDIFFNNLGYKMPGASTIIDNINAISVETLERIHDAQVESIIFEGLDNFKNLTIDSTPVSANSAWPVDSILLIDLPCRIIHFIESLPKFGCPPVKIKDIVDKLIKEIKEINKQIQFSVGKKDSIKKRKKLYNKLYRIIKKIRKYLIDSQQEAIKKIKTLNILPSKMKTVQTMLEWVETDLFNLDVVISHSSKRINEEKQTPSKDKLLSMSDDDAAMIAKGQRVPIVGYKPQICRSENGFIPAVIIPIGNANDAGQMRPIVDMTIKKTGVLPDILSFDDGYSNIADREKYLDDGVKIVSFSGSKGKKIISKFDYESDEYQKARNNRSSVESLMFTIKHNEGFGKVMRRGIVSVRSELLEKVLVYNFFRSIKIRSRQESEVKIAA